MAGKPWTPMEQGGLTDRIVERGGKGESGLLTGADLLRIKGSLFVPNARNLEPACILTLL